MQTSLASATGVSPWVSTLTVRCFYVVQKQKGVADAMIKANAPSLTRVSFGR
jgi:hypothetical protein